MKWRNEWKKLVVMAGIIALCFWLPMGSERFRTAVMEALHLVRWYAREHVLLCLVPAFFIAGAISVFVSQASVMKYLGAKANKFLAYGVASVSGTILAVCSCTVLPLFAGIYRMGAGLGPATAFLYSGPAINVLAMVLTTRILGWQLGLARAIGAIGFSVVIGLLMHFIFRKEEAVKAAGQLAMPEAEVSRPLWKNAIYFAIMVGILVFANWGSPNEFIFEMTDGSSFRAALTEYPEDGKAADAFYRVKLTVEGGDGEQELRIAADEVARRTPLPGLWSSVWQYKWLITAGLSIIFGVILILWFGVPAWKIGAAAVGPLLLAVALPTHDLWVLLPFGAGVVGLVLVLATEGGEAQDWLENSWGYAKQIMPLLLAGVLVAGLLLGRVGSEGLLPSRWVAGLVGGNSLQANFFASVVGCFMYFATLTEVPILQGLMGAGMGNGPALALLLAGPALSLPNMLVIRSIMGTRKTVVFVALVVVMATLSGLLFGALQPR